MLWPVARRRPLVLGVLAVVMAALFAVRGAETSPAHQADRTQSASTPTTAGGPLTVAEWTGTVPVTAAGSGTSTCDTTARTDVDRHDIQLAVPPGTYDNLAVRAEFIIEWKPATTAATNDLVLTVVDKGVAEGGGGNQEGEGREVGSSDGGAPKETVIANNLRASTYEVQACGFANTTPQDYRGRLVLTAEAPEASIPSADPQGLSFSATLPADPQRDEAEPNMEIDGDGNIYTCGPSGVSQGVDYAQVSLDGGDQFHLMGRRPRGQQAIGGGGDCSFTTSFTRNARGVFDYATTGLGPLTNFSAARSGDLGRTLQSTQTASVPGVDRQWSTFVDATTVLLNYNRQVPRQVVVQRSTDKGLTYGPQQIAATPVNPSFPGPMRTIPPEHSPTGKALAYFPWNDDEKINFAISEDGGLNWKNCQVATSPGDPALFVTADHDNEGNVYVAYSEEAKFHTYMSWLPKSKLLGCNQPINPSPGQDRTQITVNPGWSAPVQVDRDAIRTTVFGWIAAGGEPGRVAVGFYGTEADGNPNTGEFRGSWDVYVNVSTNAMEGAGADFSQVKATTHPFHYDSICLNGLGCNVSGGDRSLADFFAIDFNPKKGTIHAVYNQGYKRPDDVEGSLATPAVVTQVAGPSLNGGNVEPDPRPVVRQRSEDRTGDAFAEYSRTTVGPSPESPIDAKVPALDFESVRIGDEVDPSTGERVERGGFTVRMQLADLSEAALERALADTDAEELIWIFRWVNGFRSAAAVAKWSPGDGFSFGFNGFVVARERCGSTVEKCLLYPGDEAIAGRADQPAGTLTLSVPRDKLRALSGPTTGRERPDEVQARPGSRLYDGTAFSLANPLPAGEQSYLYPVDNAPSMDFLVPGAAERAPAPAGGGGPADAPAAAGGSASQDGASTPPCRASRGFSSATVSPRGRGAQLKFSRTVTTPVQVDVFQSSHGRRVIGERLVARFSRRTRSFRWNGRANRRGRRVRDGYLFVRFRVRGGDGRMDVRRVALRRVRGRLDVRPGFYGRSSCGLISSIKLERSVYGGRTNRAALLAYRITEDARVSVRVLRGRRVVRTYAARGRQAATTYRLRFDAERRPRGDYRFEVLAVTADGRRLKRAVTARRL